MLFVRFVWASILLAVPGAVIRSVGGIDETASRRVVRVLASRHLVQAAIEARLGPAVLRKGAAIDVSHACTGIMFGIADRRWRRPALIDAAIAAGFAGLGWRASRP